MSPLFEAAQRGGRSVAGNQKNKSAHAGVTLKSRRLVVRLAGKAACPVKGFL